MKHMKDAIPSYVRPTLWSYDIDRMDLRSSAGKKRVITNVLNYGTQVATDWLFATLSKDEIRDALVHPLPGEWNKKSLHFWSLILEVPSGSTVRQIP